MLIFGSTALKHWFPDLKREPKDLDIIYKEKSKQRGIEHHWADGFQYIIERNIDSKYVDKDFLYTIKVSHACYDVRWDKTIVDILFMKKKGCKLDTTLYRLLLKDWEKVHGSKKHIVLKGSAEQFFNKNITRALDHDKVHEIVKFYDRPLHEAIRKDLSDVKVSKELWDKLSHEDKIKCALEEIFVFALERYFDYGPKAGYNKAIKQLITQSTRGFFNLFLIENFQELLDNRPILFSHFQTYKKIMENADGKD